MIILSYIGYSLWEKYRKVEPFIATDPILYELQSKLVSIHPKFNDVHLQADNKSFTINKKKIHICTHDKNGKYYDKNTLVYVLCHELTHVLHDKLETDENSHSDEFFALFHQVLQKATSLGLYNPAQGIVSNYCGYNT